MKVSEISFTLNKLTIIFKIHPMHYLDLKLIQFGYSWSFCSCYIRYGF